MSLESLRNPLERLSVLPTTTALRTDAVTNSAVWDATTQYFKNDIVISGIDGGAYVYTGGEVTQISPTGPAGFVYGGSDPAESDAWVKFTETLGATTFTSVAPVPTFSLAANVITVTGGVIGDVYADSTYMVTLSYTINSTAVGGLTATQINTFQVASNGTGGTTAIVDVVPLVGAATQRGTATFVVQSGTSTGTINLTLTGSYAGTAVTSMTASSLIAVRLN